MMLWLRSLGVRTSILVRTSLMLLVIGLAVLVPTTALTIEYTAQPEFCNSCHIMEPYYESWASSSHANVSCIECHYEPGTLETVEGKFKALSQLSKYVTRTQGTKPWAEVSDQSCMRSGCHSVRMLEGTLEFGRVKFDHRHHLLESRRGRRLRCTSCHSQIVQGDHVTVTDSVCFMCHFMPKDGKMPETSDCRMCHGPPTEEIEVAGAPFDHADYLARGVDCRECHDPVVEGEGLVRRERCHSCHGEIGHIERIGETAFLHEMHVTEHKVECSECHDEIHHGLLPLEPPEPTAREGCGACHVSSHDATRLVYAGTGAVGVEDRPGRMYQTRVVCQACHTGRSGYRRDGDSVSPHGAHHAAPSSTVARAGAVDCLHCHGIEFDGMLESWQSAVGRQLAELGPLLDDLEPRLTSPDAAESEEATRRAAAARANLELVEMDGSLGAHNISYVLDVLATAAADLEAAWALVDPENPVDATSSMPFRSEAGCTECHLGMEHAPPVEVGALAFSHERHLLAVGLDCDTCHSTIEHGSPAFPRSDCASCHHAESENEDFDPYDCSACHERQESWVAGAVDGFPEVPGVLADKDCESCHGEPPDIAPPNPKLCELCHDEEYAELPARWRATTDELVARVEAALAEARARGVDDDTLERARRALRAVAADGSGGAHNAALTERVLNDALAILE